MSAYISSDNIHSLTREEAAIRELLTVSKDTRIGGPAEGAHLHVVHLSDAGSSLQLLKVSYNFPCTECMCMCIEIEPCWGRDGNDAWYCCTAGGI
jgi:hypothetical protein